MTIEGRTQRPLFRYRRQHRPAAQVMRNPMTHISDWFRAGMKSEPMHQIADHIVRCQSCSIEARSTIEGNPKVHE